MHPALVGRGGGRGRAGLALVHTRETPSSYLGACLCGMRASAWIGRLLQESFSGSERCVGWIILLFCYSGALIGFVNV